MNWSQSVLRRISKSRASFPSNPQSQPACMVRRCASVSFCLFASEFATERLGKKLKTGCSTSRMNPFWMANPMSVDVTLFVTEATSCRISEL